MKSKLTHFPWQCLSPARLMPGVNRNTRDWRMRRLSFRLGSAVTSALPAWNSGGGGPSRQAAQAAARELSWLRRYVLLAIVCVGVFMTTLDTEEAQEKIVKTFPLKNAEAEDVAKQLQDLYKDQDSSRYPYYYFFSSSQTSRTTRKMSVVADRRRNTLIVQAPPASMDYIGKMIAELDEPTSDKK